MTFSLSVLDWLSLVWFFVCWIGYTRFSGFKFSTRNRLQDAMHEHIKAWIVALQARDNRIVDTAAISNIERNGSLFTSSTLLIIAGLTTALGSSDKINAVLANLPFLTPSYSWRGELGIVLMLMAFIYAFFTFTWCIRQWAFASILVGSTPAADAPNFDEAARNRHQEALSKVIWLAVYHFNAGLRAYYFSLALLAWFIHPLIFMLATAWIVAVLYRREFKSRTLSALLAGLPETTD
ncbi:DUF599 domain-containing protein [Thiolinea disciformis]|uniref:DUF599 domain-containing protein n=1 Tax=Thiolinea disciformis TaxID=125614 RepID=UPI0003824844|nr:DUF599 family protein [Thiolinea disciformis]